MMGLTPVQSNCLSFMRSRRDETGTMPSYQEIAEHIGVKNRGRVCKIMSDLEDRGAIRRLRKRARAIEIVEPDKMKAVLLNDEIYSLISAYAASEHIGVDTAANELLRGALGATA